MRSVRDKATSRVDGMRLILESTPSDSALGKTLTDVDMELEAIDRALDGNGSYLGILDQAKLRDRRRSLGKKRSLVEEERRLLQALRVAVVDEERIVVRGRPKPVPTVRKPLDTNSAGHVSPAGEDSVGVTQWKPSAVPKTLLGSMLPREMKDPGLNDFLKNNMVRASAADRAQVRRGHPTRPVVLLDAKRHRETDDEPYGRRGR